MMLAIIFVILLFKFINDKAIRAELFTFAGYTYGFFSFGFFTKYTIKDKYVPLVAVASPFVAYLFSLGRELVFRGYKTGFEILIYNGLITFIGLLALREKTNIKTKMP